MLLCSIVERRVDEKQSVCLYRAGSATEVAVRERVLNFDNRYPCELCYAYVGVLYAKIFQ